MKLVDILAWELKAWPDDVLAIEQDRRGTCLFRVDGEPIPNYVGSLADDAETAKVTRAEWQAAVDALKVAEGIADAEAGNLIPLDDVKDKWASRSWNGEGLPPVGMDVEIKRGNCTWIDGDEWQIGKTATVMASFLNSRDIEMASVQFPGGHCECILARCLSPIRTAEQVAAEEREAEDNEVMSRYMSLSDCEKGILGHSPERVIIGLMRVMGYRKEPKPCGS